MSSNTKPVPQQLAAPAPLTVAANVKETFGQKPEDLDVTRNNEPINEFQAKTVELKNQRPQWITYFQ